MRVLRSQVQVVHLLDLGDLGEHVGLAVLLDRVDLLDGATQHLAELGPGPARCTGPVATEVYLVAWLGVPLIFGIFRKELSLVMLFQALGTAQVASVLTAGQMMTFTLFVLFYVPCIATIAVLRRELGTAQTGLVFASTTTIALVVGLLGRGAFTVRNCSAYCPARSRLPAFRCAAAFAARSGSCSSSPTV